MEITKEPAVFVGGISRSGTTLIATMLDSSSEIAMGYELIPAPLPAPSEIVSFVRPLAEGPLEMLAEHLRSIGRNAECSLIMRASRAGVSVHDVLGVLDDLISNGDAAIQEQQSRIALAWRLISRRREQLGARWAGFKFNTLLGNLYKFFPNGRLINIVRDPRDVVFSQRTRGFNRTVAEMTQGWIQNVEGYLALDKQRGSQQMLLLYERFTAEPNVHAKALGTFLEVENWRQFLDFQSGRASIHKSQHPNLEMIQGAIVTTQQGRWKKGLEQEALDEIYSTIAQSPCAASFFEEHYGTDSSQQ